MEEVCEVDRCCFCVSLRWGSFCISILLFLWSYTEWYVEAMFCRFFWTHWEALVHNTLTFVFFTLHGACMCFCVILFISTAGDAPNLAKYFVYLYGMALLFTSTIAFIKLVWVLNCKTYEKTPYVCGTIPAYALCYFFLIVVNSYIFY